MSRTDSERAVAERLQRLADHAEIRPSLALAPDGEPLAPEPRRQSWTSAVAAAVVLVVGIAAAAVAVRDGGDRRVVTAGANLAPLGSTTERLAPAPIAARVGAASVWTGKEVLVWSGQTLGGPDEWLTDGTALESAANRWRALPPAPIGPRSNAVAVWTGSEMVVWGGIVGSQPLADGATFNPQTNRWRTIASRPSGGATLATAVWSGTEMLVFTAATPSDFSTWAYDPKNDRWRQLAAPPWRLAIPYPQAVWNGSQAVLLLWQTAPPLPSALTPSTATGAPLEPGPPPPLPPPAPAGFAGPNSGLFLASYSPETDQWTRLPATPMRDGSLPRLLWTGRELLVLQAPQPSAAFDFGRQAWRSLAAFPGERLVDANPVWTGRWAMFWAGGAQGLAYDLERNRWSRFDAGGLSTRSGPVAVWTGEHLVGWSGFGNASDGSGRLDPRESATAPPRADAGQSRLTSLKNVLSSPLGFCSW